MNAVRKPQFHSNQPQAEKFFVRTVLVNKNQTTQKTAPNTNSIQTLDGHVEQKILQAKKKKNQPAYSKNK